MPSTRRRSPRPLLPAALALGAAVTVPTGATAATSPPVVLATITAYDNGVSDDVLRVRARGPVVPEGAPVKLFRKDGQRRVLAATGVLDADGRVRLVVPDLNGSRPTAYWAVVGATERTLPDRSRTVRVR